MLPIMPVRFQPLAAFCPQPVGPSGPSWNPSDKTSNATLSNSNLTAVSGDAAAAGARSTTSHTSGKFYWEMTVNSDPGGFNMSAAIMTATSSFVGADAGNILCFNGNGQVWVMGSLGFQYAGAITAVGNVIQLAVNLATPEFWVRGSIGTQWNAQGGLADPSVPGSGQPLPAGAMFAACTMASTASWTVNFGATSYVNSPPSGYGNW